MTVAPVVDEAPPALSTPGRCTRCRRIGPRTVDLGLCAKCLRWTDGGTVGPRPLDPEIAEPYLLKDQGLGVQEDEIQEDDDAVWVIVQRAIEAPEIQESIAFSEKHRHIECEDYSQCLSMAVHLDWYWFTCQGCRKFQIRP